MTLVCSCGGLRGEVRICEGEAYLLHLDPAEARGHVGARARSLLQDGRHELFALVYQDAVVHERLPRVQSVLCTVCVQSESASQSCWDLRHEEGVRVHCAYTKLGEF